MTIICQFNPKVSEEIIVMLLNKDIGFSVKDVFKKFMKFTRKKKYLNWRVNHETFVNKMKKKYRQ